MEALKTEIEGNRKITMPINGVEARALETAAEMLEAEAAQKRERRHGVAGHLLRLNARWRLRDRVT